MQKVSAKKHLGQHFLKEHAIAETIAKALQQNEKYDTVLEIGPGMGVLTQFLLQNKNFETYVAEIDVESVDYLKVHFPQLEKRIIAGDFLKMNLQESFGKPLAIIGNFPYNISTQILFKVLEYKNMVPEVVGMFQKEVAWRIASGPGNKDYGILSVLLQAYYNIEYLFTVEPEVFDPPPKVKSGVLRCTRTNNELPCDEKKFKTLVKLAFNQRRKVLGNSIKSMIQQKDVSEINHYLKQRAEELHWTDFVKIVQAIDK